MDLKHVHIAGYKNLVDTTLAFETSEPPITIIGNNGAGKSNLIEALEHDQKKVIVSIKEEKLFLLKDWDL